ncbi:XdhC family protein [Lichenicola sp.]|uniref:XdhC family protein n=1 Tax=Lichenicola sp. TaxID=2804529 RepID=UPI003B00BB40
MNDTLSAEPSPLPAFPPEDPLILAGRWHAEGERVALATVTETWGSSPRPAGSRMAITGSGRIAGSVSGGCVESSVVEAALETIADRQPRLLSFGVSDSSAWSVGLACGGTIRVFVEMLAAAAPGAA